MNIAHCAVSMQRLYARVQAVAIHTLYGYIDYLARNILPDLADEDWLTKHGNIKRCPQK